MRHADQLPVREHRAGSLAAIVEHDVDTGIDQRGVQAVGFGADRSADVKAAADKLYDELKALGVDVLLDDRGERPGAMFADWELIGIPHRVVLGDRGLKEGQVEYQGRRDEAATRLAVGDVLTHLKQKLA